MKKFESKKLIIIAIIVGILIFISIIFSILNMGNSKIYKNISIQGINVSGKEKTVAEEEIKNLYEKKRDEGIVLNHNDLQLNISYDQLNILPDFDKSLKEAYEIGRKGNIITNNYSILFTNFIKRNIEINFNINEKKLDDCVKDVESKLPDLKIEGSYYIEGNELIISKGKTGVVVETDKLKQLIIDNIKDIKNTNNEITIPVKEEQPKDINIEQIVQEIKKEPKDAYLSENPLEIHADENGIDIGISIEEAKEILSEDKEEYSIPLNITPASTKVADLGEKAFTDLLATYTTNYDSSNVNRDNNLVLAASKLNGTIVNPEEEFSYNKTIGKRTIENGFKEAKAYAGGEVVLDVGGGICQLSSTLYNSVLLANLEVTDRHNHYFKTSYVPEGQDATVSWGSLDFKFKNNRKYPIKIEAKVGEGVATINIYGIKQDKDYLVKVESKVTNIIKCKTEYKNDYTLKKGTEVTVQNGENGCTSETYKSLIKNGVVISKTLISTDTYNALPTIIKRNP